LYIGKNNSYIQLRGIQQTDGELHKYGKVIGVHIDNIHVELIKMGGYDQHKYLYGLIKRVWQVETLPEEWRKGILCPIHKKGDPLDSKN
jgi:hypothetical protein